MAKDRKTSVGSANLKEDDHALGLATLGSAGGSKSQDGSSTNTKTSGASTGPVGATATSALDHLDALGGCHSDDAGSHAIKDGEKHKTEEGAPVDDNSGSNATLASSNQRLLLEALMMTSNKPSDRRDRLESWGGMSDLSVTGIGETGSSLRDGAHAAALAASALHHTGLIGDVTAAAAAMDLPLPANLESISNSCNASVASSISGDRSKSAERKYSLASLSDASHPSANAEGREGAPNIQAFVAAAMATVSEQLAELAGAVESVASSTGSLASDILKKEAENPIPPVVGSISDVATLAAVEVQSALERNNQAAEGSGRPRSLSTSSATKHISVDYDAVTAAVNAAEAAAGAIDLASIASMTPTATRSSSVPDTTGKTNRRNPRKLPLKKSKPVSSTNATQVPEPTSAPIHVPPLPETSVGTRDMEAIRARARAAAGYVPPSSLSSCTNKRGNAGTAGNTPVARAPIKKRARRLSPEPSSSSTAPLSIAKGPHAPLPSHYITPGKAGYPAYSGQNTPRTANPPRMIRGARAPNIPPPAISSSSKGQSSQKWDDMFSCLVKFIEDRREEHMKGRSDKGKAEWVWDGNVPTTYKTPDGKALGRWINNQRSAKHKGSLKKERESRLVSTGLKWCVLSTNSWTDMMNELRKYVKDKTKDGQPWDGNVPTNYRIKGNTASDGCELDEEKNLGRWINRQRSLYQAGKLKKERQLELEKVGLRWSVLSTTSWQSMYDALCKYVKEKKEADPSNEWDGNVPANYKTNDSPPKSLGRWVNRQRSAYSKNQLKQEFVDKLNQIGLRWSVHERKTVSRPDSVDNGGRQQTQPAPAAATTGTPALPVES